MKSALLLINKRSRSGQEAADKARSLLEGHGYNCLVPEAGDDFRELIRQYGSQVDITVIGGGDGTLNFVGRALLETNATVGILPLGTANDLGRTLAIPEDLEGAVNVLVQGHKKRINLGLVNDRPFFNVANIGFGTDVNKSLDKRLKKNWGTLSYFIAAVKNLFVYRPFRVTIRAGDRTLRTRAVHIAVGNGCFYGGGLRVHKHADIEENNLCVYVVKPSYLFRLFLKSRNFMAGDFENIRGVRFLKHNRVTIETRRSRPVFADGEEITRTPARFTVQEKALEVLVPDTAQTENNEGFLNKLINRSERHAA